MWWSIWKRISNTPSSLSLSLYTVCCLICAFRLDTGPVPPCQSIFVCILLYNTYIGQCMRCVYLWAASNACCIHKTNSGAQRDKTDICFIMLTFTHTLYALRPDTKTQNKKKKRKDIKKMGNHDSLEFNGWLPVAIYIINEREHITFSIQSHTRYVLSSHECKYIVHKFIDMFVSEHRI